MHYAETSHSENHVRAVCGMPLGSTKKKGVSYEQVIVLDNILYHEEMKKLQEPGVEGMDYGKDMVPNNPDYRKGGHVAYLEKI